MFPSYGQLRRLVSTLLGRLGLGPQNYTLGGLRAGGATMQYLRDQNIPVLMRNGRWASMKTLDHYIQEAATHLNGLSWTLSTRELVGRLARRGRSRAARERGFML